MKVVALCDTAAGALRLWRALRDTRDVDLRFLVCGRSPYHEIRALKLRDLPAAAGLLAAGRLRIARRVLHDPAMVAWLRALAPDVGLHAMGVIYRRPIIDCFRIGILNPHIGLLPRYRGRSVMEWSILEGRPTGLSTFLLDEGIDTGRRIVVRREIPLNRFADVRSAKAHLFGMDAAMFAEALDHLRRPGATFLVNEGDGRRYYAMSRLFTGVVGEMLRAGQA